ncbi:lipopolysaccharide biosynthesis protein, putative [hydrothermal vent metagenome]|uniref:Lipopolysaccharide biosynthesis protein, putative n=1 Tax=hydrothermal vent metagenome TaxID=652676 RepID=A0A1W1C7D1_9ZZZZ
MKLNFRTGAAFASKKAKKYFEKRTPQDIKNIVVIRHAAIGDFMVMRPFLIELRKYFPNAKITLSVLGTSMYGMPEDLVDNIHIVDKYHPQNRTKKTSFLYRFKQIKTLPQSDIIFDLTDSSLSLMLSVFSQASIKIGYSYRAVRRFFYDISTLRSDFVWEGNSILHQLQILGANTEYDPYEFRLSEKSTNLENPYIIYFAGASVENRCWGNENFTNLIAKMSQKYPRYKHIILQGIKEDEKFEDIYTPLQKEENVVLQKALPLEDIYDYLAEASLVVVGDTGIRNMAVATNTPTLGIMWVPYISPLRYLPKLHIHKVVFNPDFVKPSREDVFRASVKMIDTLYEK